MRRGGEVGRARYAPGLRRLIVPRTETRQFITVRKEEVSNASQDHEMGFQVSHCF